MKLYQEQVDAIEMWIMEYGRPLEKAKWQVMMRNAEANLVLAELLKYQNADGGFGNGLEPDITMPESSATASAEALFIADEYGLLQDAPWLAQLLAYFENTADEQRPMTWEQVPNIVETYPHAPWWQYQSATEYRPNPGAVAAAVLIIYGNATQQDLGLREAERALAFLMQAEVAFEHDLFCLQFMVEHLLAINSPMITDAVVVKLQTLIHQTTSFDSATWEGYVAKPLDFVDKPNSLWYSAVEAGVEKNFTNWIETLHPEGYWQPNFSWGEESNEAQYVTQIWRGVVSVQRVTKFKHFGLIE
ncbi:hypothetical protein [Culicoidibacter larvae]|uniref:Squalene cyclase C-terminal domain-containing protein n=1 Tax=Culicoidibacter larvae TaxID=2579976 RepID=A0A5R8QH12_9FIRM|nr:hypothetical protein [Culicoidibacter larvae]TLG76557.1 hypothetical protein FEZ08_02770 [Culicoidibacter larvae]